MQKRLVQHIINLREGLDGQNRKNDDTNNDNESEPSDEKCIDDHNSATSNEKKIKLKRQIQFFFV